MGMHSIGYTTQVALSSTTGNLLSGSLIERAPSRGMYTVHGRHATAAGTLVIDAWRGLEQVANGVGMQAAAGGVNISDDLLLSFGVNGGETVVIKLRETAGTATNPSIRISFRSL